MSARSRRVPWFRPDPATRYAIETGGEYGMAVQREQEAAGFVSEGFRPTWGAPDPDVALLELRGYAVDRVLRGPEPESLHVRFASSEQAFAFRGRFVDGVFVTETRVDGEWVPYVEPPDEDSAGDGPGTE